MELDRQASFCLEMFSGLTYLMKDDDDVVSRVECGGKEQGGTPSAVG